MSMPRIPEPTVFANTQEKEYMSQLIRVLRNNLNNLYSTVSSLAFTAEAISYDNTTSGIVATNVQAAIDELYAAIAGSTVPDGDKGDITVSAFGTVWEIDEAAVTYAKIQNVSATDRLLGRDTAAAGNIEELTVGGGIEFTGAGGIQTSALTGDATKTAGGTALTLATVNANVGSFGSATQSPSFTVNAKGLITAASNNTISIPSTAVSDFTEAAQDAVGAMVDTTLSYTDGTPALGLNLSTANTWLADISVPDEAYGVGWNGSVEVPTKNAVYDEIETKADTATTITIAGTANEITSSAGAQDLSANRTWTLSLPSTIDLGGKDSFEIPNSAAPTVNADGEIALDTTVTDFSHGVIKYYGGEEMAVVAMPIAQLTTPVNGYVVTYNATNDEFELAAASAVVGDGDKGDITISGGVWSIDNDVVTYAKMQNVSATDKLLGRSTTGAGDVEEIACTAFARSILDDADEATFKATVNLEIGTDVQAYDADTTKNDVANTFTANQRIEGTTLYPLTLTYTDSGATGGPFIYLLRDSASPANNDTIGGVDFIANSDTPTQRVFGRVYGSILDVVDATRSGRVTIQTAVSGTLANRVYIADGLWVGSATGGDQGAGTINATDYYNDGVLLPAGVAAQSDQETATSTTLAVTPGRQHFHPSAAKFWAWVSQSGATPTLSTSYNVTSITDSGIGRTTVTIATDMSTANYCCVASWETSANTVSPGAAEPLSINITAKLATAVELNCKDTGFANEDPETGWSCVGFGDI